MRGSPVRSNLQLPDIVLTPDLPLFDYGCDRGDDLRMWTELSFQGTGWDLVHRPDQDLRRAPIDINLG